jgi:hypothetical protein
MANPGEVLAALTELERRYDGPIPMPLRHAAEFGPAARRRLLEAEGQAAFFATLVRHQCQALRRWRLAGMTPPELTRDLALYRRQWRWWRREAARQCAILTPSAGDAP